LPVPRRQTNADKRTTSYRQRPQSCVAHQDAGPGFPTLPSTSLVYNLCVARL